MFAVQMIPHSSMRIEAPVIFAKPAKAFAIPEMSATIRNPDRMGPMYGSATMNTSQVVNCFSKRVEI